VPATRFVDLLSANISTALILMMRSNVRYDVWRAISKVAFCDVWDTAFFLWLFLSAGDVPLLIFFRYLIRALPVTFLSRQAAFLFSEVRLITTTRLMSLKSGRGRSIARALKDTIEYMENPLKTDYGEIAPEEANRIGYETAIRFTKGKYAFIVCTHADKAHVHLHIIWNSTALDCARKFRNFFFSAIALRRLSDQICLENGLSIIEKPGLSQGRDYGRYMNRPPSFSDRLRASIDAALEQQPATFEAFLDLLSEGGVTIDNSGKHLKFLAAPADGLPEQVKFTRCNTLKGDYTEAAIRERIAGTRTHSSAGKAFETLRRPNLLIDIQTKIQQGKGPGYERWAKLHNLKQMAQTLIYLQEQGLDDYDVLNEKASAASARFNTLSDKIKTLDAGLTANAELQKKIITYSKTRNIYVEYRKAGYSKKFKALHETDILLHQTAKKFFDENGYGKEKKLPTVASLREEYSAMLSEKKKAHRDYRKAKTEMQALITARSNVQRLLNITEGSERSHGGLTL
jgi:hypothetical protein